jgi:hypothetical protein
MRLELDARGVPITADEVLQRGLNTVGRKIIEERRRDVAAGRAHRSLNATEQRAFESARTTAAPTQTRSTAAVAPTTTRNPREWTADGVHYMVEIHRARLRNEELMS